MAMVEINQVIYLKMVVNDPSCFSHPIFQYSAVQLGTTGSGGEYAPQKGFGWTNGFIMELLNTWGKHLKSEDARQFEPHFTGR